MSGGMLRSAALGRLAGLQAPDELKRILSATVQACNGGFLQLVYEAGCDAALSTDDLRARGMAILFQYTAIQVCDDICDGDASYLPDVQRDGALVLMMLQQVCLDALADALPTADALGRASRALCRVGAEQYDELRTRSWTAARALGTARGLNGAQYAAYFALLWTGTPLEGVGPLVADDLGVVVHVTTDLLTGDPRFHSLSVSERLLVLHEAHKAASRLCQSGVPSIIALAQRTLPEIDRALAALRPSAEARPAQSA